MARMPTFSGGEKDIGDICMKRPFRKVSQEQEPGNYSQKTMNLNQTKKMAG
jgi:hypothetical protein